MTTKNKPQVGDAVLGYQIGSPFLVVGIIVSRGNTSGQEKESAFTSYWFFDRNFGVMRSHLKWTYDDQVEPVSPGVWQHGFGVVG